jgi:acetyl esterase/lipase
MAFQTNLDPELAPGLEAYRAMGFTGGGIDLANLPAMRAQIEALLRAQIEEMARSQTAPTERVRTEDRRVPGPSGAPEVMVRIYRPTDRTGTLPGLYWIHGGGMILGNVDQDDLTCKAYAEQLGCVAVSVEYRLAPEHPHPAPVEDCYAGLKWMAEQAGELGIDPTRIALAGASAGGGLAAATALVARDRGGPALACQILIYPMLDDRNSTPSSHEFAGIPGWSREANVSGWTALLGDKVGTADVSPYAAPARATDLSNLPPTLIQVGELEVFRDESIDYAVRLLHAGIATELHVYPGAYHAWDIFVPNAAVSQRMIAERMGALEHFLQARQPSLVG